MVKVRMVGWLVVAMLLLAACGGTPAAQQTTTEPQQSASTAGAEPTPVAASTGEKVTLNFWAFGGEDQFLPEIKKAFEAAHPNIVVEFTDIPEDQYVTKIDTSLAANDPPDITYIYERRWIKAGKYLPLDDIIAEKQIKLETFNQGIMQDICTVEGKVYCLGSYTGAVVMFYNKEMFDAAGVPYPSQTTAMTMDEYAALSQRLAKPNEDVNQQVWGGEAMAPYWWMDWRNNFSEDGRTVEGFANSEENGHTYEVLAQMIKDKTAPSGTTMEAMGVGGAELFAQKKLAMAIGDFSALATLEQQGINYGVAPVPAPKGQKPWVPVWTDSWGVHTQSDHPREAQELVAFIASEGQRLRVQINGDVPLDNALAEEMNWAGTNPGRREFLQVIQLARPGIFVPSQWDVIAPMDDVFAELVEGDGNAKEAIDGVVGQMQDRLDKAWETWDAIK